MKTKKNFKKVKFIEKCNPKINELKKTCNRTHCYYSRPCRSLSRKKYNKLYHKVTTKMKVPKLFLWL